jgi:hypothetical protein
MFYAGDLTIHETNYDEFIDLKEVSGDLTILIPDLIFPHLVRVKVLRARFGANYLRFPSLESVDQLTLDGKCASFPVCEIIRDEAQIYSSGNRFDVLTDIGGSLVVGTHANDLQLPRLMTICGELIVNVEAIDAPELQFIDGKISLRNKSKMLFLPSYKQSDPGIYTERIAAKADSSTLFGALLPL